MGKLLNYLCIFSVSFAVSYSLRNNNTSVKKSTEAKPAVWSWPGWGQVAVGRQASVVTTDLYNLLKGAVWNYGTLKFVVWNRTPNELNEGKWKAENLVVEAPVPLFVESKKRPVVVSSHYNQKLTWNYPHSLWVSYSGIPEHTGCRICIYGKLEYGWFHFKSPPKFKYAVYITDKNDCDEEKKLKSIIFLHKNYENGYQYSKRNGVTAKSAFASHGLDYVLNVYIFGFNKKVLKKQERNNEKSSNINMQQQQGTGKNGKNSQSETNQQQQGTGKNGKNSQSETNQKQQGTEKNGKNSQSGTKQKQQGTEKNGKNSQSGTNQKQQGTGRNEKNSQSGTNQQRSQGVEDETVQPRSSRQPNKIRKRSVVKKIQSVMKERKRRKERKVSS